MLLTNVYTAIEDYLMLYLFGNFQKLHLNIPKWVKEKLKPNIILYVFW